MKKSTSPSKGVSTSLIAAAVISAMSPQVHAQSSGALEEIVVTAQRRAQSLQDTPIAITAFSERELEQKGIRDITDIGSYSPNVNIAPLPSNTAKATISIRGSVTSNPAITWEPTVGIYLDNAYIGKFSGNVFKIAELERVEVLRGPQGTLYGKNTIGGAVNLITRRPTGEFGGRVRAGIGNYGYGEIYASVDTPALQFSNGSSLKARFSLLAEERDGFYDNVAPDPTATITHPFTSDPISPEPRGSSDEHNAKESRIGRMDLLWDVNDRLAVRYTLDHARVDNTPAKAQFTALDPGNLAFGVPFPADLAQYLTNPNNNVGRNSSNADTFEEFKSTSHSLFVDYELGNLGALGDVTMKYIGNYRKLDFEQSLDNDGTPFTLFHSAIDESYTQRSHELQFSGSTERVQYVLGLYYFDEEADVFNPLFPLNAFFGPMVMRNAYGLESEQYAVYGQAEWRPSAQVLQDRLSLTAGLRWTREKKDSYISHPDDQVPFAGQADKKWTNVTPTFIVGYDFTDELHGYAKYSQGWKSGGFNGESGSLEAFVEGYDPEEVDAYEIGLKSRWLDNTLQVNVAAYYHDETDLQLSVFTSGSSAASVVRNAGAATKRGVEVEVIYQPNADFQLMASYGYLDAKYNEFLEFDPDIGAVVDKRREKDNQYAAKYNYNISAEYTFLRSQFGELTARLDYSYIDDYVPYVNPEQNATSKIKGYGLLNGRLTLSEVRVGENSNLQIALWGKNLLDKDYRINTVPFGPFTVSYFGDPRTYGVEATLNF